MDDGPEFGQERAIHSRAVEKPCQASQITQTNVKMVLSFIGVQGLAA